MPVSISVRLHDPCVAAGHSVGATLTIACTGAAPPAPLAYVVAQVSGRWTGDPAWIRPDPHLSAADPGAGALDLHVHPHEAPWDAALDDANRVGGGGRAGYAGIIFRSSPLAVCIDETLSADVSTSFDVRCVLPDLLPATLRGTALRYSYTLLVVAAVTGQAPQCVRVPFRVVTPDGMRHDSVIPVPTPRKTGPSPSRFLEEVPAYALSMSSVLVKPPPLVDIEMALAVSPNGRLTPFGTDDELWMNGKVPLEEEAPLNFMYFVPPSPRTHSLSALGGEVNEDGTRTGDGHASSTPPARSASALPMYHISRGSLSLARMYVPKHVHHLGDTLTAIFDFQHNGTRCYRLNARLECQEVIQPKHALGAKHGGAGAHGIVFRKVYGEHGEFVMANRNTHVSFSIPHDAPVTFATTAVHVRWLLHFVFLIPKPTEATSDAGAGAEDAESSKTYENENGVVTSSASDAPAAGDAPERDDDDVDTALLPDININGFDALSLSRSGAHADVPGWEGGKWRGDDPNAWKRLPKRDTDALQWTLPIIVTNRHGSRWGAPSHSVLRLTS
jgi:Rgp1